MKTIFLTLVLLLMPILRRSADFFMLALHEQRNIFICTVSVKPLERKSFQADF